jgi:hypothetical protein
MGTGYTRNDTANNIADGNVINASDLDGEFDALQAAFSESTGHSHDGTVGEGPKIDTSGLADDAVTAAILDDGGDFTVNSLTTTAGVTVNGNTTLGNADTDTVTVTADIASGLIPSADATYDLGATGSEWNDLYITGTANIDALVADTADIDAGTIDGVTIGTNSVVTDLRVDNLKVDGNTISSTDTAGNIVLAPDTTGDVQLDADTIRVGDANADVTITTNGTGDLTLNTNAGTNSGVITIADAADGNIAITPNGTGEVDISKVDIDGGAIDGTTIGADTAAAATVTDLTASGTVTLGATALTADGADINRTDVTTEGTVEASKVVTADSSGEVTVPDDKKIYFGTDTDASIMYDETTDDRLEIGGAPVFVEKNAHGTVTPENDGTFDLSTGNFFTCTTAGAIDLDFNYNTADLSSTTLAKGMSGMIYLSNASNHTVTAAADIHISAADLTVISATGAYIISYYCPDGTNVYLSASAALTEGS